MLTKPASGELSKSDRRVLRIASTAARLFSMKGYVETSMDDVAAAAKISKGGMYHYFDSKSDLLNYVLSTFMDLVLENVQLDVQTITDPAEKIRLLISRHVRTYSEHVYLAKALLHEAHNLPSAKLKRIKSKEGKYFAAIADAVSSYLGEGVDKNRLTVLTFNLLGMCNWIYAWYNPQGSIGPEELSQMIFDTFTKDLSAFRKDQQKQGGGNR